MGKTLCKNLNYNEKMDHEICVGSVLAFYQNQANTEFVKLATETNDGLLVNYGISNTIVLEIP